MAAITAIAKEAYVPIRKASIVPVFISSSISVWDMKQCFFHVLLNNVNLALNR